MNDDPYDYLDADYEEYLRKEGETGGFTRIY